MLGFCFPPERPIHGPSKTSFDCAEHSVLSYALAGSFGSIDANLILEIPVTLIQRAGVRHPASGIRHPTGAVDRMPEGA